MSETFTIIYDTYCGWCYGAAKVLDALANSDATVQTYHRHLFAGANAHLLADGFGQMAIGIDAQIGEITGQVFSDTYVENILKSPTEILESGLTAQAAALVHDQGSKAELALAARLQKARYVDGVSAADREHIIEALLQQGVSRKDTELLGTPELSMRAERLSMQAIQIMQNANASGVPTVLRNVEGVISQVAVSRFYAEPTMIYPRKT